MSTEKLPIILRKMQLRLNQAVVWCHHQSGTSVEVKAESDILCTSRNAADVVNSIPAEKPILFLPDVNLGNYVKKQTGRENMTIWQGACIVHATFPARRVVAAKAEHPNAVVAAHPECPTDVLRLAANAKCSRAAPRVMLRVSAMASTRSRV